VVRDDIERPVHARLAEQQRDAREREKQIDREAAGHLANGQIADVDADHPREPEREQADVEAGRAAQHDREAESAEGDGREAHALPGINTVSLATIASQIAWVVNGFRIGSSMPPEARSRRDDRLDAEAVEDSGYAARVGRRSSSHRAARARRRGEPAR